MAAKAKRTDFPHIMSVVKLTLLLSTVIMIFFVVLAQGFGMGVISFPDAARGGVNGKPVSTVPGNGNVGLMCPEIYSPVCGSDGKTYPNGCYANRRNVEIECNGECPCGDGDIFEVNPPLVY